MACYRRDRSAFFLCINENNDGGCNIVTNTYMHNCIDFHFSELNEASPTGWKHTPTEYLNIWIPSDKISGIDLDKITNWTQYAGNQCLWLTPNTQIQQYFSGSEIDYCIAGDFNFSPADGWNRTILGEAEYQIKYCFNGVITNAEATPYVKTLKEEMMHIASLLPINLTSSFRISPLLVSPIPAEQGKSKFSQALANYVHGQIPGSRLLQPVITITKPEMKSLPLSDKIRFWKKLYTNNNLQIDYSAISGADILIVDDLYQSGITMWAYAEFLKRCGARRVYGIVCVKSLRDSDNT